MQHSMRILLVEDDIEQLEPIQAALSDVGNIVDGVEDGETAQFIGVSEWIETVYGMGYCLKPKGTVNREQGIGNRE